MSVDPSRLYSALMNTGLQQKDNALYQVIHDLIGALSLVTKQTNTIISGGGGSTGPQGFQGIPGIPGSDGLDGEDSPIIQGLRGLQGLQGLSSQGIPGLDGIDGEDALVIPGPQGIQGIPGSSSGSSSGTPGMPGLDGEDAFGDIWFPPDRINVSGQEYGSAFHNTTQSILDSTFTILNFNSEDFQFSTLHSTSVNNSRVTAQQVGIYLFVAQVNFASNVIGYRIIAIQKSGNFITISKFPPVASAGGATSQQCTFIVQLAVGEYIEVLAWQNTTGTLSVGDPSSRFAQNSLAWMRLA